MATKDFSKMTTNRLKALLSTASDEDKAVISEILEQRAQVSSAKPNPSTGGLGGNPEGQEYNNPEPLSETEQAFADAQAKANAGRKATKKLSEEELAAIATECEKNKMHRCQVVPFNTIDWVDGVIAGVITEKRSGKVLYAVKLDDGRRIVKTYDSPLIKISDEVIEALPRAQKTGGFGSAPKEEVTPEKLAELVDTYKVNVGRFVTVGEETGRIVSVVVDKRGGRVMYRINVETLNDTGEAVTKVMHKVPTANDIVISEAEFDEEGAKLNEAYAKRRENAAAKEAVTPEQRMLKAKAAYEEAVEMVKKWEEKLAARKKVFEDAQTELDEHLANENGVNAASESESLE